VPEPTAGEHRQVHVEHVMGTAVSFDLRTPGDPADLADAVALLHRADALFSTYREDSAVRRLDRGELAPDDLPAEVLDVLAACEQARRDTDGWFDARAGGALDPSGLVKGWAVQRASELLAARGSRVHSINGGGDVVLRGRPQRRAWRTGVADPRTPGRLLAVVTGGDLAVATSGSAERGAHVIDPRTGRPAGGVLSATVVGPQLVTADVLATAVTARGDGVPPWLPDGYEALVLGDDGRVSTTPGWAEATGSVSA
jgi:FAD:protein FMN transferase